MVADSPGAGSEGDLQERVTVQQHDNGDEEAEGKGEVGGCFVGFIEGVGV